MTSWCDSGWAGTGLPLRLGLVSAFVLSFASAAARAEESTVPDELPFWSKGRSRPFASGRAIAGTGYARLAGSVGYGKPHWMWLGAEAAGFVSPFHSTVEAGLHGGLAIVDVTLTIRRTFSFSHVAVPRADSIESSQLHGPGPKSRYTTLDVYFWGFVPIGRGVVAWDAAYMRPLGERDDVLRFEEFQRVVMTGHGLVTTKVAPMVPLGRVFYVGVLGEHLSLLGRPDSLVLRLGPTVYWRVGRHWDLTAMATLPVTSPDGLDLWDGMYSAIGLRYRFATGEPKEQDP